MKINLESLKKILNNSDEVMLYGLKAFQYQQLGEALLENKVAVNTYADISFKQIDYEPDFQGVRECKASIVSLVLENYRRIQNNQPIIPLLFCVGLTTKDKELSIDIEEIATSHKYRFANKEIRRCYRIISQCHPEIKRVAEETFRFINLSTEDGIHFNIQRVEPVWHHPNWLQFWQKSRVPKMQFTQEKIYPWREIISLFLEKSKKTSLITLPKSKL